MSNEEEIRKNTRNAILSSWLLSFQKAIDCDTWGEPIDAEETYKRYSVSMKKVKYNIQDKEIYIFSHEY